MDNNINNYYELLVQNAKKGEIYSVKFKNDPVVYSAMPMIPGRLQNHEPQKFVLNVLAPKEYKGVYEKLTGEIETIE